MKDVSHVIILVALVGALFFLLTWSGVMKCRTVPGWCNIYWDIVRGGQPRIMIVYGDSGMGNPDLLKETLADPTHAGIFATLEHIDRVSLGNLKQYDLVIVEKARQISSEKLKMFMDYVNGGGRLVWTGDSGTESESVIRNPDGTATGNSKEFLFMDEDPSLDTNEHLLVGPWARKFGTTVVAFHEFLGVQYLTNYCSIKPCQGRPWQGKLVTSADREHPLVYALRTDLVLRGDFAIVEDVPSAITTRVLTLDWMSNLIASTPSGPRLPDFNYSDYGVSDSRYTGGFDQTQFRWPDSNRTDFGRNFPLIVTSGYGERVAYYAVPPEQFVEPDQPQKYYSIVENLYYGMLR
jgi:hypothetical protein